jgi:hypothetical protein
MRTTEQTGAALHADGPTVAIIVGSTRAGRKADTVASGSMTSPPGARTPPEALLGRLPRR